MSKIPTKRSRQQREEWRTAVAEQQHIQREVSPRILNDTFEDRLKRVPDDWKAFVADLQKRVRASPKKGREWSLTLIQVGDMLEHLLRAIRGDLGLKEGEESLASMLLLMKAFHQLKVELRDGNADDADTDEDRWRVYTALRVLTPRYDDVQLRRMRAMKTAGYGARWMKVPTEAEAEASVEKSRQLAKDEGYTHFDEDHQRRWFRSQLPAIHATLVHEDLREIDERFAELDPLVVMEEFSDACGDARGGRSAGGDGQVGPIRALARLAVMCGALEFKQAENEEFDVAVERARTSLLVTRSRIRKVLRGFPGLQPDDEGDLGSTT